MLEQIVNSVNTYTDQVLNQTAKSDWNALSQIIEVLINVKENGGKIFTIGNGGSSSTASHMANDFLKGCRVHNRVGFNIECLADSNAIVTCLGNDFSYEEIFSIQLKTKAKAGDVLVYYSGSGNSLNLVYAAQTAREMGMITIGFLGRDGGALKMLSDYYVIAPSQVMEQIEDMHMMYEHTMASVIRDTLQERWGMEIVRYPEKGTKFQYALFDFDGTVSLIREGWQEIMIPYFIEVLKATPQAESDREIEEIVTTFVDKLTGKQTIFQCMRLDEEVVKRGGKKENPGVYKKEYLRRLMIHIKNRLEELRNGCDPEKYLVPGSVELIRQLKEKGYHLYLASGTDEEDVLEEARLLGLDKYFGDEIHGAHADMTECSKEMVIREILRTKGISGKELVSFGDGFVEIELVKNIGGYAIGVATDEVRKKGINERKRNRLLEAGANVIIPDFAEAGKLVDFLERGGK